MSHLVVFTQVTLDDVRAHAATMKLDEELFVADAHSAFGQKVPADADEAFARALSLNDDDDAPDEMDERWSHVCETLRYKDHLATPSYPCWPEIIDELKATPGYENARVIRPIGVRTLKCRMNIERADGREEPCGVTNPNATTNDVLTRVRGQIAKTIGGDQFLVPDPDGRALAVLATTLTAILADPEASERGPHGEVLVRRDVYEKAVASIGLGDLLPAIRRLFERDHKDYEPHLVSWPDPASPKRPLGILTWHDTMHVALDGPTLKYAG
jgi:hypothetical protein